MKKYIYICDDCGARYMITDDPSNNVSLPVNCKCGAHRDDFILDHIEGDDDKKPDMVNHPPHYQSEGGIEVIDVIKAFVKDLQGIQAAAAANVIKYICRWKNKDGLRDLKKAEWYLKLLIEDVEKSQLKGE